MLWRISTDPNRGDTVGNLAMKAQQDLHKGYFRRCKWRGESFLATDYGNGSARQVWARGHSAVSNTVSTNINRMSAGQGKMNDANDANSPPFKFHSFSIYKGQ